MKIKLVALFCFATLFVPSFVKAQSFTPSLGCFVDFTNPNVCSNLDIICGTNYNSNYLSGGYTIAQLCDKYNVASALASSNYEASQSYLAQYNSLVGTHNGLVTNYNSQLKLIKKLRKACGTKCKKIK